MKIIRSDRLKIQTDTIQLKALNDTLAIYRNYVRDLMLLINARWHHLSACEGNAIIQAVEGLIHPTSKRPDVKYRYFHRRYYKFPSYLRRAAIMDACGQVRSFRTHYDQWLDGDRRSPAAMPPCMTAATGTYPSLYRGQMIKLGSAGDLASIKVYFNNDWIWMLFRLCGKLRFSGQGKALSPLLIHSGKHFYLSIPNKLEVSLKDKTTFSGQVLSVDVGINTAATCAVVDRLGTAHDRVFIHRRDKDREHRLMQRIRSKARKQTRHGNKLPKMFCSQDHRRLKQSANNEAHQISRQIVNLAIQQYCDAIVLENLKHWRPKAGRKRSTMKARFHRWFHRMLCDRIASKAQEVGIRIVLVYARGTSSLAFDGSGKVRRDKSNFANATFASGKRYNADLNAAYNIAARGIMQVYYPDLCKQMWSEGKPNACPTTGTPLVLSSLWLINQRKAG